MLHSGLTSVTFRKLAPRRIVELAAEAGLEAIEWGGDMHCPPGQIDAAREVARMTRDAGLHAPSYGSYYRVGGEEKMPFEFVLETAQALGAATIRVWAGDRASEKADAEYRASVARQTRRVADWAADLGIRLGYEFHANTLTDTNESAVALLRAVEHPNVGTYWQPPNGRDRDYCLAGLKAVLPWLVNVHAFAWRFQPRQRLALAEGQAEWDEYLAAVRSTGREHSVMLEFVRDDDVEAFRRDAATLKAWLGDEP